MNGKTGMGEHSTWAMVVACAVCASTAFGLGYTIGRNRMSDLLDEYKQSAQWELPELIAELEPLASDLRISVQERASLKVCQDQQSELERLRPESEATTRKLKDAEQKLARLEGDTFDLIDGATRPIVPGRLVLGVTAMSSDYCHVRLGEKTEVLSVGQPIDGTADGATYRLILLELKTDPSSCRFSLDRHSPSP